VAILFAINVLNFYDRGVLSALTEPIRLEFGLSDTQIGWMTTSFTLLFAVIGVPLGRLADHSSRKKLLAGGVSVWSLLTATTAIAGSYGFLLFSRLGIAVGEAVCAPAATSWLGDLFPSEKRSRALALFMLGVPIGGGLSFLLSGPLAQAFGWRLAMAMAAAPALLLVPALLTMREPVRGAYDAAQEPQSQWSIARTPTMWWIIASGAVQNFIAYAFYVFLSSFLIRVHGLSIGSTGIAAGLLYTMGGVCGGLLAGRIGDWVVHKRTDGRMLAAALAALISAPLGYLAIVEPAAIVAILLLGATYCFLSMYYGLVYSSIHDIVPPSLRATALAFYLMMMYLCGASFGPVITGNLSDRMARSAATAAGSPIVTEAFKAIGLRQAMLIIPALSVALALVLYAGSRTIRKDMSRLR
jgi:predicted MFS family arabinose efflux permease